MATLITATLPCAEFALSETLETIPEATFECETIVDTAEGTVMPLVWARAPDADELEVALAADPTVNEVQLLSAFDDNRLYRMEWGDHIHLIVKILVNGEATILNASIESERWVFRILYPTHDGPSETMAFCENHGLPLDILSIQKMESGPSGRYGLTKAQYEAVTTACEQGYYKVPQEADLHDLAESLNISHQALSERLHRGIDRLVTDTLLLNNWRTQLTNQRWRMTRPMNSRRTEDSLTTPN